MREQVMVLPNFSMTDYGSQGKGREENVVHLNNCKNHHNYYVALSRGYTAEGTCIMQGFDPQKIINGISGYLRQEFRELELLDEITKLRTSTTIASIPSILVLHVNFNSLILEEELSFGQNYAAMKLLGLIYHCDTSTMGHFTSIVIDTGGEMWCHDGISTRRSCIYIGTFADLQNPLSLHQRGGEKLCAVIYALK
jgi:hypothetical protein